MTELQKMKEQMLYSEFIQQKSQANCMDGFDPLWLPEFLFPFQSVLVDWSVRNG
jgi:hypothetical protein